MSVLSQSYDFRLQFQDPEFDNLEDLPAKTTIKIVKVTESDLSSNSTDDTMLLSDNTDMRGTLPMAIFVVPNFSYEVEYTLPI